MSCTSALGHPESGLTFSASGLELVMDQETGAWTRLMEKRTGRTLLELPRDSEFFSLAVGGTQSPFPPRLIPPGDPGISGLQWVGKKLRMTAHAVVDEGDAALLRVECREGDWLVTFYYRVPRHQARVERRFAVRYLGSGEVLLRGAQLTLPLILGQEGDVLEMPVSAAPPAIPLERAKGRRIAYLGAYSPGLIAVRNPRLKNALLWWGYSESEPPAARAMAGSDGVRVTFSVPLAARMREGSEVSWGSDYVWALEGDRTGVLGRFQKWWKEIGVTVPEDRPAWAERALLYETQIGTAPFDRGRQHYGPYPTTQALIDKLDYIRGLGFTVLELMPRMPFPSYCILDYYDPARQYADALKSLVEQAHRRGMRVILDWITHGVVDQKVARRTWELVNSVQDERYKMGGLSGAVLDFGMSYAGNAPEVHPLRLQHPEWFMKREDGGPAHIYTWALDLENPEVEDYVIEAMKYYVREYDIDGFRVDAPTWNSFPNWDRDLPYRASRSATGGIRLFERALPVLRQLKPDLMLYTEPSGPQYRRMFDVHYSYDELWILEQLLGWRREPAGGGALTAYQARLWMDSRRRTMPAGSVTIHQVDSHDSFWFRPWGKKFRRQQFGVEGFRALLFMLSTVEGGLMHYGGGEEGSEEFMKRVFALRREIPELRDGRCDYLKVRISQDSVFAVSWESPSGWAIPLINFGSSAVKVHVELPQEDFAWDAKARYRVREVFHNKLLDGQPFKILVGNELRNITLPLDSLESALLEIRREDSADDSKKMEIR